MDVALVTAVAGSIREGLQPHSQALQGKSWMVECKPFEPSTSWPGRCPTKCRN